MMRLIASVLAGLGAAVGVVIVYAVVDLYMSGHGKGWSPERGDPWYYPVFTVLMLVSALVAGVVTYRRL